MPRCAGKPSTSGGLCGLCAELLFGLHCCEFLDAVRLVVDLAVDVVVDGTVETDEAKEELVLEMVVVS